jgi:hypothetical protein
MERIERQYSRDLQGRGTPGGSKVDFRRMAVVGVRSIQVCFGDGQICMGSPEDSRLFLGSLKNGAPLQIDTGVKTFWLFGPNKNSIPILSTTGDSYEKAWRISR